MDFFSKRHSFPIFKSVLNILPIFFEKFFNFFELFSKMRNVYSLLTRLKQLHHIFAIRRARPLARPRIQIFIYRGVKVS